jgi:hypothetical protein
MSLNPLWLREPSFARQTSQVQYCTVWVQFWVWLINYACLNTVNSKSALIEVISRSHFMRRGPSKCFECFDSGAASGWAYLEHDTGIHMILPYITISPPKYWFFWSQAPLKAAWKAAGRPWPQNRTFVENCSSRGGGSLLEAPLALYRYVTVWWFTLRQFRWAQCTRTKFSTREYPHQYPGYSSVYLYT